MVKVHSLLGPKEIPHRDAPGGAFFTDEHDDVEVPAELAGRPPKGEDPGEGLLAQVDAWAPVKAAKASAAEENG